MKIYNLTIALHLFASIFQALLINYAPEQCAAFFRGMHFAAVFRPSQLRR